MTKKQIKLAKAIIRNLELFNDEINETDLCDDVNALYHTEKWFSGYDFEDQINVLAVYFNELNNINKDEDADWEI